MRVSRRTILGIEIGPHEIRLVEVRGSAPPQVLRLGSVPLPEDALDGDRIVLIDAVANLVRGLVNRLNCQTRVAVFGIGMRCVITRVVQIPHVAASELRVVIEGELAHYHILRTGMGAFDCAPVHGGVGQDAGMQSMLIMAVEQRIARGYRQVAEKAGLELLALEPVSLALYRTAFPRLMSGENTLCLMATGPRCDLSITAHGNIRLYRRLEIGTDDFLSGRQSQSPIPTGPIDFTGENSSLDIVTPYEALPRLPATDTDLRIFGQSGGTFPLEEPLPPGMTARLRTLAEEIQRSLDYYRREFPAAEPVGQLLLCTNDPHAATIENWLRRKIQLDVKLIEPPTIGDELALADTALPFPRSLKFLAAYGLALHPLTSDWKQCPQFNLMPNEPTALRRADRERAAVIFGAGLIILITGLIAGQLFARLADLETTNVSRNRVRLATNRRLARERDAYRVQEQTLERIVRSDHLPVGALLEQVIGLLPSGVRLISVDIQRNGHMQIEGEARTSERFNEFYVKLQECPLFATTRYTQLTTDERHAVTQFRIETSVYGTQDAILRSGY